MYLKPLKHQIDSIKNEWEKFIEGKEVNSKVVSNRIKKSWERSRAYGVDPFNSLTANETVQEKIKQQIEKYGYMLQLFDKSALPITNPIEIKPASEKTVGTNPIWFALTENKPIGVLGYEHYNALLHVNYSAAAPIHDLTGNTIGAINITCRELELAHSVVPLATLIAQIFETSKWKKADYNYNDGVLLKMIFDYLPQGAICFEDGKARLFNKKILDILQISQKDNAKEVINDKLSHLASYMKLNRKRVGVNIAGVDKSLYISSAQNSSAGDSKYKVLFVEHEDSGKNESNQQNASLLEFDDIIGQSAEILAAKDLARKVATAQAPVLIYGESGVGKELFAQAIHHASSRRNGPFVAINCGAIPSELVESELFGYEPGAFTGALKNGKQGLLELASGGSIFLDEIESMPLYMQVKLLRAISSAKIVKVGGTRPIPIDVRILSAAKSDLLEAADKGTFRADLYYRISTFVLKLPALRERLDDIPVLSKHFIEKYQKLYGKNINAVRDDFFEALMAYNWRGNVRELENVLERTVYLAQKELTVCDLPEYIQKAYKYNKIEKTISLNRRMLESPGKMLQMGEEIIIESVLRQTNFNIGAAAQLLGISVKTLYNKINNNSKLSSLKLNQDCSMN